MAQKKIPLPGLGEGVIEATVTRWLVQEGDAVEEDQPLVEIATDKVDTEVESPVAGTVVKILHDEGETVKVGEPLLLLEDGTPEETEGKVIEVGRVEEKVLEVPEGEKTDGLSENKGEREERMSGGRFLSPLVRKIAKEEGISGQELEGIAGSGSGGRLTKEDVLRWLAERGQNKRSPQEEEKKKEKASGIVSGDTGGEDYEVIEMDRVRRLIAGHMVESVRTAPHVTSFIEADVTGIVTWRERIKEDFFRREGEKITFTPVFLEAVAQVLREMPMVNISVDGTRILRKKHINIGMATALPDGNLIVPVIHDADRKSLPGLVKEVNDLASRARAGALKPHEIKGGTFTVTNFGTFRNLTGTPIINQPESAILGIGAILKKPAVVETPQGDALAVRHLVILSLSYDHRVIDGALGGRFLQRLAEHLESFDTARPI